MPHASLSPANVVQITPDVRRRARQAVKPWVTPGVDPAALERRGLELDGTRRRLEQAGRRDFISQERNRIARELHDKVAQHLLTIGMHLEWCRRQEQVAAPVRERMVTAKELARAAVDELRSVIYELASDGHTELREALRGVIADVEVGTRVQVTLRSYGSARPLAAVIQHALVQIAREALFNVVRHAEAHHAWIAVRWLESGVAMAVADDGRGCARELQRLLQAQHPAGPHLGLAGIAERVRALGGTTRFARRPGGGVRLIVEVPAGGRGGVA